MLFESEAILKTAPCDSAASQQRTDCVVRRRTLHAPLAQLFVTSTNNENGGTAWRCVCRVIDPSLFSRFNPFLKTFWLILNAQTAEKWLNARIKL